MPEQENQNRKYSASDIVDTWLDSMSQKLRIPLLAVIETTTKCNFKCVHCHGLAQGGKGQKKELSYRQMRNIIDQFADMGMFVLTLTGGEPLVRPDIWKIIEYGRKKNFMVRLNTNGSLITEKVASRIADYHLADVYVSVYGMNESTYTKVTGCRFAFGRVMRGIERLLTKGIKVTVRMPILRENYKQYARLKKFALARSIGCFKPMVQIFPRFDGDTSPLMHAITESEFDELYQLCSEVRGPVIEKRPDPSSRVCEGGSASIVVSPFGEVRPCLLTVNRASVIEKPISEIWKKDPLFVKLRNLRWRQIPKCLHCKALMYCDTCPAISALETGSFTTPARKSLCVLGYARKRNYERTCFATNCLKKPCKD